VRQAFVRGIEGSAAAELVVVVECDIIIDMDMSNGR
jgi:hypothetical protein